MSYIYEVFVLRADGGASFSTQPREPTLMQLRKAVGGPIQLIPHFDVYAGRLVRAYANEEGKLRGLPRNETATRAWRECLGDGPFSYDPVLCGDVVLYNRKKM